VRNYLHPRKEFRTDVGPRNFPFLMQNLIPPPPPPKETPGESFGGFTPWWTPIVIFVAAAVAITLLYLFGLR
jgi:hypothetical protein